jgi:hypothetical protein
MDRIMRPRTRKRFKQLNSLKARLEKADRERLMRKARQFDDAAHLDEWLSLQSSS